MTGTTRYWWLGFNTKPQLTGDEKGVYLNPELQAFLDSQAEHFRWPAVGTPDSPKHYEAMSRDDRVVIWTGGGSGYRGPWGVLGFATVLDCSGRTPTSPGWVMLSDLERFDPIRPFDVTVQPPQRTGDSDFLADLFGEEFQPLHKVFTNLGYPTRIRGRVARRVGVTTWELEPIHFWALHRRAKRLTTERQSRRAA